MKNRALALVFTVCMIFSIIFAMPLTSYAKTNDYPNRAVRFLTELNIIEPDEYTGEFWEDSRVKRFEIAQILCRLLNYDVQMDSEKKFIDVSEQDRPYIETVVRNGIMSGYGDGKFGPDDYVTSAQVIKVFVDLIGGGPFAELLGGFPNGYISAASKLKIAKSVSIFNQQPARRIDIVQIIYNALNSEMLRVSGFSNGTANYEFNSGVTLLSEICDIKIIEGKITAIDTTSLNRPNGGAGKDSVIIGEKRVLDPNHYADEYFGSNVKAYVRVNESTYTLIYIEEEFSNEIIEIWGNDIKTATNQIIKYKDGGTSKEKKFSPITDMVYNGKAIAFDKSKFKKLSNVNIKIIDSDSDGIVDFVNITEYKDYVIERANVENEKLYFKYGEVPLSLEDNFVRIVLNGETSEIGDLSEGTVVSIAVSDGLDTGKWIQVLGCTDSAYGAIDQINTIDDIRYATLDGKEYAISSAAETLQTNKYLPEIKVGVGVQIYLNANGEIVYFTGVSSSDNVGYLVGVKCKDKGIEPVVSFKIYTDKGKMETFSTSEKIVVNDISMKTSKLIESSKWTDILNDVVGKQLIKYAAEEGVIKKITYCLNTPLYNRNAFSLDVKESLYVRRQNVLDYTYSVDSSTKVFVVPTDGSDDIEKYKVLNGTYFKRDKTYDVSLYDLDSSGRVSYAIVRVSSNVLTVDDKFMFVAKILKKLNSDDDVVNAIQGYDTAGNFIEIISLPDEPLVDYSDATRMAEKGDLIQYSLNALGSIETIKVVHKLTDITHQGIGTVHTADRLTSFGYAANVTSSGFLVTETIPSGEISPLDAKVAIPAGGIVLLFDKDDKSTTKVSFSDILPGDEIFTLGTANNTTMITIIYR